MTDQLKDKIKYEGEDYCHFNFIFPYKDEKIKDKKIKFPYDSIVAPHTALWKGFHTSAEVIDKRLLITEFFGYVKDKVVARKRIEISYVVEDAKLPLFAHWFSRSLTCYRGNDLSLCKELLILRFDKGLLAETKSINKRQYFRNVSIGSILDREKSKVQLAFEHTKGCFREIRMRGELFWIESFNDDDDNFQTYDEISRDAESVTMSLKKYEPNDGEEYLVKTLLKEGQMQYSIDNGKSWNHLYEVTIQKQLRATQHKR
jgi:hypothetical protein